MRKQDDIFIQKRNQLRKKLIMTRLGLKPQTYQKLQGQVVNKMYDGPLQDWEVEAIKSGLDEVKKVIAEFETELKQTEK